MSDDRQNGLDDLDRRIAEAKAAHTRSTAVGHGAAEGHSENAGWAVGIEFVGSVLVGAIVGLLLDKWLHTAPWIMIVLIVLGFIAGLRRAMTMSKQFDTDLTNDHQ